MSISVLKSLVETQMSLKKKFHTLVYKMALKVLASPSSRASFSYSLCSSLSLVNPKAVPNSGPFAGCPITWTHSCLALWLISPITQFSSEKPSTLLKSPSPLINQYSLLSYTVCFFSACKFLGTLHFWEALWLAFSSTRKWATYKWKLTSLIP